MKPVDSFQNTRDNNGKYKWKGCRRKAEIIRPSIMYISTFFHYTSLCFTNKIYKINMFATCTYIDFLRTCTCTHMSGVWLIILYIPVPENTCYTSKEQNQNMELDPTVQILFPRERKWREIDAFLFIYTNVENYTHRAQSWGNAKDNKLISKGLTNISSI